MILPPFAHADAVFGFEDILEPLDVLKPAKARYFVYGHLGFCQIVLYELQTGFLQQLMYGFARTLLEPHIGQPARYVCMANDICDCDGFFCMCLDEVLQLVDKMCRRRDRTG